MAWSKFDSMYLFIINYGNRSENKVNSVYACLFNLSRTVCVRAARYVHWEKIPVTTLELFVFSRVCKVVPVVHQ